MPPPLPGGESPPQHPSFFLSCFKAPLSLHRPKSKLLPKARDTLGLAQTAGDSRCSRGARDSPTPSPPAEASRPGRVAPHIPGMPGSPGVAITKGHVRSPRRREGWQGEERGTERWGWGGRKPLLGWAGRRAARSRAVLSSPGGCWSPRRAASHRRQLSITSSHGSGGSEPRERALPRWEAPSPSFSSH